MNSKHLNLEPRIRAVAAACGLLAILAGCANAPTPPVRVEVPPKGEAPAKTDHAKIEKPVANVPARPGRYYQDDGPGDNPPANLDAIPDAEPRVEPPHRFANDPYVVLGHTYQPLPPNAPYRANGIASWYGRKFHGQRTATGEIYDMYGMSAAHPTLPLPSYVRVTNTRNGKSVTVRVNDRGPFHADRLIDLSYTAAYKLGLIGNGSGPVEVERIDALAWVQAHRGNGVPIPPPAEVSDIAPYWLQFGAFSVQGNAEGLLGRLQAQLGQTAELLRIVAKDGLYRLRAGPFKTEADASALAAQVKRLTDVQTVVLR